MKRNKRPQTHNAACSHTAKKQKTFEHNSAILGTQQTGFIRLHIIIMKENLLGLLFATFAITASAQNGINSPYSRYGFGIQSERALGFNKGMGGVAQGFRNGKQINIANPASYSAVDSLSSLFDLGLSIYNGNYKMGGLQQNAKNSSFDYFAYQFKAAKNVGMTVGIMPVTNINYDFSSSTETLTNNEDVTSAYRFAGNGGLREVMLGAGWKPFKPISIGLNVSYLWGDYEHSMSMAFSESSAYSMYRKYNADISTYNLQAGIQLIQPLGKNDGIVIGGTYTYGHDLHNIAYRSTQTLNGSAVEAASVDSIKNAFQLPHSFAVGVTYYHSNKFRIGADFELQKWSNCLFPDQSTGFDNAHNDIYRSTKGQLNDKTKFSLGFDYTPNSLGRNYFNRCTYKMGAFYSRSYANADPTNSISAKPYELGVSAGMTLPMESRWLWRNHPSLNFSVQWVHTNIPYMSTATLKQSALTENYLKFCVGLSFNERWFYKYKVE